MGESLEASIATMSWPKEAKHCDVCKSATALLFCGDHSAFLCIACDSSMHKSFTLRHGKVWVCEVCEQAPASVNCKADAAALCVTCDFDIHSANPLSQRHERTPVVPFFDRADLVLRSTTSALLTPIPERNDTKIDPCSGNGDLAKSSTDSWASSVTYSNDERSDLKSMEFLISEYDQLMDSNYGILINDQFKSGCDSVVPVQNMILPISYDQFVDHSPATCFEIDFTRSCINSYNKKNNFTAPSHRQSVSSSSMEVGVVPDGGSVSEISYSYGRSLSSSIDLNECGGGNQVSQFPGIDREARVLRYREKRKNRKFQKTIRYASRKTYAEIRPRIKGRFARRTEVDDCGIDQCFGTV